MPASRQSEFREFYYPPSFPDDYAERIRKWGELLDLEGPEMQSLANALLESGTFVTPTFVAVEVQVWGDDPETRENFEPDFAPSLLTNLWRNQNQHPNTLGWKEEFTDAFKEVWPNAMGIGNDDLG